MREAPSASVCDPYQPLEERYGRTRALLEEMAGSGCEISIATRSDLVLRDLDLIRQFPNARVSWSINTLDEGFRSAMDRGVPVERRLAAMKAFHDAGVRTTCLISPIFPGITDAREVILAARDRCNLVWLENLDLRGDYKPRVLGWIAENPPELSGLYDAIYSHKDRSCWHQLDEEMRAFCEEQGLEYLRADDSNGRPPDAPPIVANCFFHEEVKKSARK